MCGHCFDPHASFRCPSSHGAGENVPHRDYMKAGTISSSSQFNTSQAMLPLLATTSRIPSDPDILLASTQRTYEGSENPTNMVQPPDDVIDYWFHQLGLSLDTPLAATLSDWPSLSSSVSVLGDTDLSVSHIVVMLYHIHQCSRCALNVREAP